MDQQLLEELLTKNESEMLDFKATLYRKEQYEALLKDILGMANANVLGSRYIVMGVKQYTTGESNIIGVSGEAIDSSTFQQLVLENIEPALQSELHYFTFQEKQLAVLEVVTPEEQPYMLKKQYGKLHIGTCYVRKGATNGYALRTDFDRFYMKRPFEIRILHPMLRAVDSDSGCASLECSFRNLTEFPVTIHRGFLEVNGHEGIRSRHLLSGYGRDIPGADYRLYLAPKTEISGDFQFDFTSSDCLRIGLNTDGYTGESLQFTLTLVDTTKIEYSITLDDCDVFAKGEFLWKVRKHAKQ
ncbi:AlbA family DNA-binding domain-containing protein [Sporosarcina sp. FSL K6-3457]|uniref:AlbA family DNA-binding domain-containing protein n=1 Tax=Sporosarcina sp. FSL K6-3457 TaxID=2978204 RepID=UPI0030FC2CB7